MHRVFLIKILLFLSVFEKCSSVPEHVRKMLLCS